jgi:cell wall-associated NlpC family hydrolase
LVKRATTPRPTVVAATKPTAGKSPVFIENISIKSENKSQGNTVQVVEPIDVPEIGYSIPSLSPEAISNLQFKYAILLDVPVEHMYDAKLLGFLESWYGTKYRMGGTDRSGVDCSAFVQHFMMSMYNTSVPRTSGEQFIQSERITISELQEGDLVFFRTQRRKQVSHVGVYLRNNKFAHASTSSGVMISDLRESYFKERFVGAGRYVSTNNGTH